MCEGPGLRNGDKHCFKLSELRYLHNRDIELGEAALDLTDVDLLQLAIADVVLLVDDTSTCTSNRRGRERGSENEAGSVGTNHVDKVVRPCNVTADSAISLAQST